MVAGQPVIAQTFDIVSVDAKPTGTGALRSMLAELATILPDYGCPAIFFECVLNPRLATFLQRNDYRIQPASDETGVANWFKV